MCSRMNEHEFGVGWQRPKDLKYSESEKLEIEHLVRHIMVDHSTLFDDLNFELFVEEIEDKQAPFYLKMSELEKNINTFINEHPDINKVDFPTNKNWKFIVNLAKEIIIGVR